MAQKNINIGSSANKGDGDPIRTAFSKTQDNFTDLYARIVVVEGQVGIANQGGATISQSIIGDVIGQDSTVIIDSNTNNIVGSTITATSFKGDINGSVFGDDSSLLVDAVNGNIPGYVSIASLKTEVAASTDFADFKTRIAAL